MPDKKVAILQSSYIPWKGYFDLINMVDEFILYDDRQYTKRDWRSRNRIKTANGLFWLSVPVKVKGRFTQRIDEVTVDDPGWARKHWQTIAQNYSAAPHFKAYRGVFEHVYQEVANGLERLTDVNRALIEAVTGVLGIKTRITRSTDYPESSSDRTGNLVDLCKAAEATSYLSGPSARAYIEVQRFEQAGIALSYMDYSGYPEYPQLFPPFEHQVTVLDLLFNTGPEAQSFMKSFK